MRETIRSARWSDVADTGNGWKIRMEFGIPGVQYREKWHPRKRLGCVTFSKLIQNPEDFFFQVAFIFLSYL
jgi:hypothetical protein